MPFVDWLPRPPISGSGFVFAPLRCDLRAGFARARDLRRQGGSGARTQVRSASGVTCAQATPVLGTSAAKAAAVRESLARTPNLAGGLSLEF